MVLYQESLNFIKGQIIFKSVFSPLTFKNVSIILSLQAVQKQVEDSNLTAGG